MKHLIFFDSHCPLCRGAVSQIMKRDKRRIFSFAPLDGKTIEKWLEGPRETNTLILLENFQKPSPREWVRARGVFRIYWLLGGKWSWIGWLYLVPGLDLIYRFVARHRHHFVKEAPAGLDTTRLLP